MSNVIPVFIERNYLDKLLEERITELVKRPVNLVSSEEEPDAYAIGRQLGYTDALKDVRELLRTLPETKRAEQPPSKAWHHG